MRVRASPLVSLGCFLVSLMAAACADALGSGQPSPNRLLQLRDSLTTSGGGRDTTQPDSEPPPPPPPPPDTTGRAMIRGIVTGIDSTVTPPRIGPIPRAVVTLFAIVQSPGDSSASTTAPPKLDSIAVALSDRAGRFLFTGLRQRFYALRAVAPAGSGFTPSGTRARAVLAEDSTQVPITYVYLHKVRR